MALFRKPLPGDGPASTFVPDVSFTGYPDGIETKFTAGEESAPMPAEFIELMRTKGLVRETPSEAIERTVEDHEFPNIEEEGQAQQPQG